PAWATMILAAENDPAKLAPRLAELENVIRKLAAEGDVLQLKVATQILDKLSGAAQLDEAAAAAHAAALALFKDPATLVPVAGRLLQYDEEGRDAATELM